MLAMATLDRARPGVAAQALGLGQGRIRSRDGLRIETQTVRTESYSVSRQSNSCSQITQRRSKRHASLSTLPRVLWIPAARNFSKLSAMGKLFASDVAMRVTTDAVQIFGGYGYCRDYPIEKYMRDAKITQIYEGTNQIQRLVIARTLIKELASQRRRLIHVSRPIPPLSYGGP